MSRVKSLDWWTACNCPYTGCPRLALAPEERSAGCRRCWLDGYLQRFPAIHTPAGHGSGCLCGDSVGAIHLHPQRLAKCLRTRKPQRFGWILGEPPWDNPEYLAACVGVALATPHHGYGVPTSDPAGCVQWARAGVDWLSAVFLCLLAAKSPRARIAAEIYPLIPPQNWLWLLSISTQQEADERLPYGVELGRLGWRWGVHAEPLLEPLSIIPDAYGTSLVDMPDWVVAGAAKGHAVSADERGWYESIRDQCAYAGVPFWIKTPEALPGETHMGLPDGWPEVDG